MAARSISTKQLRAECAMLERALPLVGGPNAAALAPHRPGGEQNEARDAQAWLSYYRHLQRLHARLTAGADAAGARGRAPAADADVLDALRSAPVPVPLVGRAPSERPLYVYAKSFDALLQVHALDAQLAWMTAEHHALLQAATPAAMDLMPQLMEAISYTYQLLAWIVTTKGPGMPYALDDDRPEPPEEIRALEPWDMVRIVQAHHTHLVRLQAISLLIDERPATADAAGTRPSWSAFWGALELETGASAEQLMKHRALASVLAANRMGTGVRQAAMDAARATEAK